MNEDLRALMRAELNSERPPPLGDVVGAAVRAGRRTRRRRRIGVAGAGAAGVLVILLSGSLAAHSEPRRPVVAEPADQSGPLPAPPTGGPLGRAAAQKAPVSPGSVPITATPPTTRSPERNLAIPSGTDSAAGPRKKATTGAMLHLLTQLLPPGRTSHAAVSSNEDLYVQMYLDRGAGPGMVRMMLGKLPADGPRGTTPNVSVSQVPDNCLQSTVVVARWADGTAVQVDVASCLAGDGRTNPPGRVVLSPDEAARIAADPRWGVTMDADLIKQGEARFGGAPVFTS
ncbi:hypothetical protein KOI35_18840 [Actinoplanes bogorensis]|uniref:Uncharacterized protein n=1 Tax=Paractinoplanes bogorensis TaxID=1610840 RepID=A0ABS5YQ62_9ACTN|nr:hypothetical protein [Actinoplanes bogorensis]MBU2665570.1 hypothetical protein [Actinoplanes bogorensis]